MRLSASVAHFDEFAFWCASGTIRRHYEKPFGSQEAHRPEGALAVIFDHQEDGNWLHRWNEDSWVEENRGRLSAEVMSPRSPRNVTHQLSSEPPSRHASIAKAVFMMNTAPNITPNAVGSCACSVFSVPA